MKKFVIYKSATLAIVSLTDDEPDFKKIKDDEDFDTVSNWMKVESGKKAIEAHLKASEAVKPKVKLTGEDGNVFVLVGICTSALKKASQHDKAKELTEKVFKAKSYDEALGLMSEYCDVR